MVILSEQPKFERSSDEPLRYNSNHEWLRCADNVDLDKA